MCGIAGFSLNPKDTHINARRLAQLLLLGIEHRGYDATGAAWLDRRNDIVMQKRDVTASKFVGNLSLDRQAPLAILHTRLWTQGKPENPLNNHPIRANHIVGTHNGTVSNDDYLMRLAVAHGYEQQGEVDSEAIFATIARTSDKFNLIDALESPEAKMALAWVNENDQEVNTLHLARGDGSPLVIAQTVNGSLIYASEWGAIEDAAKDLRLKLPYREHVKEGTYYKVRDGMIAEAKQFYPTPAWAYYTSPSRKSTAPSTAGYSGNGAILTNPITKNHHTSYLDMRLLDPGTEVELMSDSSFESSNKLRVEAIGKWMEDHAFIQSVEDLEDHAILGEAALRGAFLRPGHWVQTEFMGEWCDAQVYRLPKTFPEGDYILRVLAPIPTSVPGEYDVEPVFLARTIRDIESPELYVGAAADEPKETEDPKPLLELLP